VLHEEGRGSRAPSASEKASRDEAFDVRAATEVDRLQHVDLSRPRAPVFRQMAVSARHDDLDCQRDADRSAIRPSLHTILLFGVQF
jgi:hypothetical protein